MNFASHQFFVFLPLVFGIYHLLPSRRHKYCFLLAASWLFYMSWNPWFIWVVLFTSMVDYTAGRLIEKTVTPARRRCWVMLSVITNLGLLGAFKYTAFLTTNAAVFARAVGWPVSEWTVRIVLPLGISFHTFQGISYTLDVYRRKIPAVRSFVDFALFVAFFPQLVAGPIVRAVEFLPQMSHPPLVTRAHIQEGLHWFLVGLFKKVFLADRLAQFVDVVFARPETFDSTTHRWAVLAYAAQIYCDFSGYSDMAVGCAKWFGFELPQNFNFPYLSGSIAEFWRRWHISLSTWMRDYLYVPLGGSRRGTGRTSLNLVATMTLCGLWHGASWNYVLWGFYNGVLLALHRAYDQWARRRPRLEWLRHQPFVRPVIVAGTFLLVAGGLVLVRSESWMGCWQVEYSLVGGASEGARHAIPAWVPLLVGMVAVGHLFSGVREVRCRLLQLSALPRAVVYTAAIILIVVFAPHEAKAFIYFQF